MSEGRIFKKDLNRQITRAHRDVLDGLVRFELDTGEVYPTFRGMARMFEVARSTAQLAIEAFVKLGWVIVRKWTDEQGQIRNAYEFAGDLAIYVAGIRDRKKKETVDYVSRLTAAIEAGIRRQMSDNIAYIQRNAMSAARAFFVGGRVGVPKGHANLFSHQLTYEITRTGASIEAFEGKKVVMPTPGKTKALLALQRARSLGGLPPAEIPVGREEGRRQQSEVADDG